MKKEQIKRTSEPFSESLREMPEMKTEAWSTAVRGKFAKRIKGEKSVSVVAIEEDLQAAFPNDQAVNDALRLVVKLAMIPKLSPAKKTQD